VPKSVSVIGSGTAAGPVVMVKAMPLFQKWQSESSPNARLLPLAMNCASVCNCAEVKV
jgi:hypothetical protein